MTPPPTPAAPSCPSCGSGDLEEGGPGAGFGCVCTACGLVLGDSWLVPEPGGPASGRTVAPTDDGTATTTAAAAAAAARHLLPAPVAAGAGGGRGVCFADVARAAATKAARTRRVKQLCGCLRLTGAPAANVALVIERAVADTGAACTAALLGGAAYLVVRQHRLPVTLPEVASAAGCPARDVARTCVRLGAQHTATPGGGTDGDAAPLPATDTDALQRRAVGALFPTATAGCASAVVATSAGLLRLAGLSDLLLTGRNPRGWAAAALHTSCACHALALLRGADTAGAGAPWPATASDVAAAMHVGEDTLNARLKELHAAVTWLALGCDMPHCAPPGPRAALEGPPVGQHTAWLLVTLLPSLSDDDLRAAVQAGQARVLVQQRSDGAVPQEQQHLQLPPPPPPPQNGVDGALMVLPAPECGAALVVAACQAAQQLPPARTRRRAHELRPLGAKKTRGPAKKAGHLRRCAATTTPASKMGPPSSRARGRPRARGIGQLANGGEAAAPGVVLPTGDGDGDTLHDVIADDEWVHLLRTQDEMQALQELQALE